MMNSTLTSTSSLEKELEGDGILSDGIPSLQPAQLDAATGLFKPNEELQVIGASFPELIDNTARSNWVKCPQLFFRSSVQSLRLRGLPSIHLHAGGAFAKALEVARVAFYEDGLDATESERRGLAQLYKSYGNEELEQSASGDKSIEGMVRGYESYMLEYPLGVDRIVPLKMANGRVGVEFTFSQVIPELKHPETGNPILYGGRFDLLGVFNKQIFVVDEKTTTSLGDRWARQWELDSQFTGYCWGARSFGYAVAGAIIRGIGLLKTKTTHAEAIIYRPKWMVDRWLEQLQYEVEEMIAAWKKGYWKRTLDKSACDAYSGCPYKTLCATPNPEDWLNTHYQVVVWDPLAKH